MLPPCVEVKEEPSKTSPRPVSKRDPKAGKPGKDAKRAAHAAVDEQPKLAEEDLRCA